MDFKKLRQRILSNVEIDPDTGCWNWLGYRDPSGYGHSKLNGKTALAHRVSFTAFNETSLTTKQVIRHSCDNPSCCNPDHLAVGTHADNVADKMARGREARGTGNGRSKLNESQVEEIFTRLKKGHKCSQLAKEFGVHPRAISLIASGKNWPQVTRKLLAK